MEVMDGFVLKLKFMISAIIQSWTNWAFVAISPCFLVFSWLPVQDIVVKFSEIIHLYKIQ